jgi:demethylmenaquinone methyltransferase/2-methoxy-6-polyprenyl-1,4-benzoquinol methylase
MKKKRQTDLPARHLKIYYARAMDGIETTEIEKDDRQVETALSGKNFSIANPYNREQAVRIEDAETLVRKNTDLLEDSDVLLANLSRQNYTYIGAIFEIVQACSLGKPVVAYIGNSDLGNRYYLHYYCSFICRNIDEAIEYIWRCCTPQGCDAQLNEEKEFYDTIATEPGCGTGKPYKNKQSDIERYTRERGRLKEKLRDYCCDKNVVELGCGTGEWTQVIAEVAKSVICIESSWNMIKWARERLRKSPVSPDFMHADFLDETLLIERSDADVMVFYFTLSVLPPLLQNSLLSAMKKWVSTDGHFLFGESVQMSTLPSIGLGRQRIQTRRACGKEYSIYKERFAPYHLQKLLNANGFKIVDLPEDARWFTFCAARA